MDANLAKYADNAQKCFNRFVAQLRREGHAKKEASFMEIDEKSISLTARVLKKEYLLAQDALDSCAAESTQMKLPGVDPKTADLSVVTGGGGTATKTATEVKAVPFEVIESMVTVVSPEFITQRTAKGVMEHDGQLYVAIDKLVIGDSPVAVRVFPCQKLKKNGNHEGFYVFTALRGTYGVGQGGAALILATEGYEDNERVEGFARSSAESGD